MSVNLTTKRVLPVGAENGNIGYPMALTSAAKRPLPIDDVNSSKTYRFPFALFPRLFIVFSMLIAGAISFSATPYADVLVETFDEGSDPAVALGGGLLLGDDGPWTGKLLNGKYVLTNRSGQGAVRYIYVDVSKEDGSALEGPLEIGVDVVNQYDGEISGAGLIYGVNISSGSYYLFTLMRDSSFGVFFRGPGGFDQLARSQHQAVEKAGTNRITIRMEGDRVDLFINGVSIGSHEAANVGAGGVGIVGMDTGAYEFDNFRFEFDGTLN